MNKETMGMLAGKIAKWAGIALVLFVLLGVLLGVLGTLPFQFAGLMLLGWITYLGRVLPQITFNPEIAFDATVALLLAVFGLHRILGWWTKHTGDESAQWRFGWTLKITVMVLLLFATSIAAVGMVHQIAWLCREPKMIEIWGMGRQTAELSNVKQLATAVKLYAIDHEGRFPNQLDELFPDYLPTHDLFFTRAMTGDPPQRIIYYPGYNDRDNEDTIILASPRLFEYSQGPKRVVARLNTSAAIIPESQFQELIQKQQQAVRDR